MTTFLGAACSNGTDDIVTCSAMISVSMRADRTKPYRMRGCSTCRIVTAGVEAGSVEVYSSQFA